MKDEEKTKEQLIEELTFMRKRIVEQDVTASDRMVVEEALQKSKEEYRNIFENAIVGIYRTSPEGRFLTANPTAARLLGYESSEELINSITDISTQIYANPGDRDEAVRLMMEQGFIKDFEVQCRRKDGSIVWGSLSARTVRDEKGQVLYHEGASQDITERKRAEETLRDSEAKYRRIVDTANEGIWSVDGNFITTFVNRRMAWMLGYDESEMIGRPVHWFMFEEDRADLREKMRDRRAGISDRYERRYRHRDGRTVWFTISVTPLVDDKGGSFKGSFAMVTDISDRKHMEEELSKSRHELELRVRERTAELERVNSQLRSIPSKLIAVQEDERKRIAGELHDSVGQTLAALKYGIETVLVKKDGGDLAGAFNLLERFVPTLQRSIDETRGIYMGLRPPMLDSLGLLATLEWFCREFQSLHSSCRLELETNIKEEEIPDTVKIIIFRIAQEALNNAAKHSRAKRVNLLLAKSRSSIELTVKDDGEGFELDSVLSHNGLKSLGLAGMRDRAKLGGGIFSIESTPGKGTVLQASWPT